MNDKKFTFLADTASLTAQYYSLSLEPILHSNFINICFIKIYVRAGILAFS